MLMEWLVLSGLCLVCEPLRLKTSYRGTHRQMLYRGNRRIVSARRDLIWLTLAVLSFAHLNVAHAETQRGSTCSDADDARSETSTHMPFARTEACNRNPGAVFYDDARSYRHRDGTLYATGGSQIPRDPAWIRPVQATPSPTRSPLTERSTNPRILRLRDDGHPPINLVGHAFAASKKTPSRRVSPLWRSSARVRRWIECVIDSGSTWHIHNDPADLVNVRPCSDVVEDAAGNPTRCTHVGELPLLVRDDRGREVTVLLHSVRCSTGFSDTLISVDQLWTNARVDCVFRDSHHLCFTLNCSPGGEPLRVPFRRTGGLFRLHAATVDFDSTDHIDSQRGVALRLKQGLHAPTSTAHVSSLPADVLASLLHRRLHIGSQYIRRLGRLTTDVPDHIASASDVGCEHCAAANATRLPHSGDTYKPTYAGRLIHGDLAGPFKPSYGGGIGIA